MRTWTRLVPAVLLATLLALAPAHADSDQLKSDKEKIADLQREVDALKKEMRDLKEMAQNLRDIKELLQGLAKQNPVVSKSAYGQAPGGNGGASVLLRNQYLTNATFRINGRPYTVAPNRTTTVAEVPLGPITWEVSVEGYGVVQPPSSITLTARGYTLNVFPLQP